MFVLERVLINGEIVFDREKFFLMFANEIIYPIRNYWMIIQ